jgi:hypothetical protein
MPAPTATRRLPRAIHDKYREALGRPDLTPAEIDRMRRHLVLLAQVLCEHVWGEGA